MVDKEYALIPTQIAEEMLRTFWEIRNSGMLTSGRVDSIYGRLPTAPQDELLVRNVSGVEIPRYGCLQIVATHELGDRNILDVDVPSDTTGASGGFVFASHEVIPAGSIGVAQPSRIVRAIKQTGTATAGTRWKPIPGFFTISTGVDGPFTMAGDDLIATNCVRIIVDERGTSSLGDTLERFIMRSSWVGGSALATFTNLSEPSIPASGGIVEDPLGIFFDILGPWNEGLSIRTRYGRHYVIQARCDQTDIPPDEPIGSCQVYDESTGLVCYQTTEAICDFLNGSYGGDGTSCP
ncbi:hypothetical protein VN12_02295 [Pirellula sp. SH-Sr6A]|nr:hypothetical protein VN12_02295 [Pirellula sp. SH-Sr6A]